jgi:hypothetical protein
VRTDERADDQASREPGHGADDAGAAGAARAGVAVHVAADRRARVLSEVDAFYGAFAGAMVSLHGGTHREATREHPVEPRGGRMIAVCVDRPGTERLAVEALRANNARNIGRTEGDWRDGGWRDFDPRTPLATV